MKRNYLLFFLTVSAELVAGILPLTWFHGITPTWTLVPGLGSLALFLWLLKLHPEPRQRAYAIYSGLYLAVAAVWFLIATAVHD